VVAVEVIVGILTGPAHVWRETLVHIVVVVIGQTQLLEAVGALHSARRLARSLHGREQQRDEYADDGDHHQQLDQREPCSSTWNCKHESTLPKRKQREKHEMMWA
jgi:hypothetical protein